MTRREPRVLETGDRSLESKNLTREIENKILGIKKWRSKNPTTTWYESNLRVRGSEDRAAERKT